MWDFALYVNLCFCFDAIFLVVATEKSDPVLANHLRWKLPAGWKLDVIAIGCLPLWHRKEMYIIHILYLGVFGM